MKRSNNLSETIKMTGDEIGILKWAWTMVLIPIGWMYNYIIKTRTKVDTIQIEVAKKVAYDDMKDFVDRSLKPIHEKLSSIDNNVEYMRRNQK